MHQSSAIRLYFSRRQLAPFLERISYGLGQRYHYFDEISLFFETTRQHFRPRYVVLATAEVSETITRFHQNDDNLIQAMWTFRTIRQNCQPRGWNFGTNVWNVRMAWTRLSSLFDEISILFEKTQQSLGPRNVVWNIGELSRTISRFHQNNDNVVQVRRRFVPKRGRVADGCSTCYCDKVIQATM
jgi:hypothetical protein